MIPAVCVGVAWLVLAALVCRWLAFNVRGCDWNREQNVRSIMRRQTRLDVRRAVRRG